MFHFAAVICCMLVQNHMLQLVAIFRSGGEGGDQIATPSCSVCQFDFIDSSSVSVICDSRNLLLLQINNMWLVSAADCFVFFVLFFYLL
jgi:hypothetical protein